MANVDELLAVMSEPEEPDKVILTVDENMRVVSVPTIAVVIGAEGDRNVNRVWFKMNRNYRGTDLARFVPKVNYRNADGEPFYYLPDDMLVDTDSLMFSWLISEQAARQTGIVTFSLCMQLVENEKVVKEFNTTTASMQCLVSIHDEDAEPDTEIGTETALLDEALLDEAILG